MGSRAWPPAKVPFVLVESLGRGGEDDLVPGADGGSWFFFVKYPFMDVHGGVPVTRNGPFGVPDPAASLYTAVPSRDGRFIGVFWLGEVQVLKEGLGSGAPLGILMGEVGDH
jgi:hypothetical protein